jgi:hypothetical protein
MAQFVLKNVSRGLRRKVVHHNAVLLLCVPTLDNARLPQDIVAALSGTANSLNDIGERKTVPVTASEWRAEP